MEKGLEERRCCDIPGEALHALDRKLDALSHWGIKASFDKTERAARGPNIAMIVAVVDEKSTRDFGRVSLRLDHCTTTLSQGITPPKKTPKLWGKPLCRFVARSKIVICTILGASPSRASRPF